MMGALAQMTLAATRGRSRYDPFRAAGDYHDSGGLAGDHKHYNRNNNGELALADSDGDIYVEACRMIRKDGFWRIAQDLRQEGLNSFPGDYLDSESEVGEYSDYVTDAVNDYEFLMGATDLYELNPPSLTTPAQMTPAVIFPASTYENPTAFPSATGSEEQQLRARGIYLDYMSDVLRTRINCLDAGGNGADCEVPDVTSALEIIPFYDVQLTWLARWNETPNNTPIEVTNEAIADNNTHDRGYATLEIGFGYSTINSAIHKGNLGLTGTDPIDLQFMNDVRYYDLYALAVDVDLPPPVSSSPVSGEIRSAVRGVKASDVEISATGAQCDRTVTGFECYLHLGVQNPRMTVSNYSKGNNDLYACSEVLQVQGQEHTGGTNWTRFDLPVGEVMDAHIVIKDVPCS